MPKGLVHRQGSAHRLVLPIGPVRDLMSINLIKLKKTSMINDNAVGSFESDYLSAQREIPGIHSESPAVGILSVYI